MARTVRITHVSNCLWAYLDDPAIPRSAVGPKGNFVMAVYGAESRRSHYEAAVRGYGTEGRALVDQLLAIADRVAVANKVGAVTGPPTEKPLGSTTL